MPLDRTKLMEQVLQDISATVRRIAIAARADMDNDAMPKSQVYVMHTLQHTPGMSVKDVAKSMDISASAATQLVDTLVKDGFVERSPSPLDRRVVILNLTKSGHVRHKRYRSFQLARIGPIMDVLSDDEFKSFCHLHHKLLQATSEYPEEI